VSLLPQPICKADLQVQISIGGGRPTLAFLATVGISAINAGISMARQVVSWSGFSVVARNATTEVRAGASRSGAKQSVVKDYLTTGHSGARQGSLDGSMVILGRAWENSHAS